MTVIQQALFMVSGDLQPGPLTQVPKANLPGDTCLVHSTNAADNFSEPDILIPHPTISGRWGCYGGVHSFQNDTTGSTNAQNNPNPHWPAAAKSSDGGLNWTQIGTTVPNNYDTDGFNQGQNAPGLYQGVGPWSWNEDTSNPLFAFGSGFYPGHNTIPAGMDPHTESGSDPTIITSTDLITWNYKRVPHHFDSSVNSGGWINQSCFPQYGNGVWVIVNKRTGATCRSTDNLNSFTGWENYTNASGGWPLNFSWAGAATMDNDGNYWMIAGLRGGQVNRSTDNASTWNGIIYPRGSTNGTSDTCGRLFYDPDLYGGAWVYLGGHVHNQWGHTDYPVICYSTDFGTSWTTLLQGTNGSSIGLPSDIASWWDEWRYGFTYGDGMYFVWVCRDYGIVSASKPTPWELYMSRGDLESWTKIADSPWSDGTGTLYNFAQPYHMQYHKLDKRLLIVSKGGVDAGNQNGYAQVAYIDFQ